MVSMKKNSCAEPYLLGRASPILDDVLMAYCTSKPVLLADACERMANLGIQRRWPTNESYANEFSYLYRLTLQPVQDQIYSDMLEQTRHIPEEFVQGGLLYAGISSMVYQSIAYFLVGKGNSACSDYVAHRKTSALPPAAFEFATLDFKSLINGLMKKDLTLIGALVQDTCLGHVQPPCSRPYFVVGPYGIRA